MRRPRVWPVPTCRRWPDPGHEWLRCKPEARSAQGGCSEFSGRAATCWCSRGVPKPGRVSRSNQVAGRIPTGRVLTLRERVVWACRRIGRLIVRRFRPQFPRASTIRIAIRGLLVLLRLSHARSLLRLLVELRRRAFSAVAVPGPAALRSLGPVPVATRRCCQSFPSVRYSFDTSRGLFPLVAGNRLAFGHAPRRQSLVTLSVPSFCDVPAVLWLLVCTGCSGRAVLAVPCRPYYRSFRRPRMLGVSGILFIFLQLKV